MKELYQRENLVITEFDKEVVIATSAIVDPTEPPLTIKREKENVYRSFNSFGGSSWF